MKPIVLLLAALTAAAAFAADQVPLFNGTLTLGREHRFVLATSGGKASAWLRVGESFEGYTISAYDAKAGVLDLERDGKIVRVTLVSDAATANAPMPTPATLADAEEVFRVMRFDEMMGKVFDQQKKAMGPMMQQSMAQTAARMKLSDEDKEAFMAFQKKGLDDLMSSIMGPEMRTDMARIYSEVFSKEELSSLATFYGTPAGQALVDKTPEVSGKMQAILMPRMMQNVTKLQQASKDFMAELAAKRAAAPQAPAAPPAPKP